jgi:hypothetical protein
MPHTSISAHALTAIIKYHRYCYYSCYTCTGSIALACAVNPWVLLSLIPAGAVFVVLVRMYLSTSRELKRLEAVARSPMYRWLQISTVNNINSLYAITTITSCSMWYVWQVWGLTQETTSEWWWYCLARVFVEADSSAYVMLMCYMVQQLFDWDSGWACYC